MKKVMLKLENYSKAFDKKTIINDMSLEVYEGEFITFLGPSGCGKTTVLRSISGLDKVTNGKIYIDGQDVTDIDATKREVNTIFQNYALFPHLTVWQNIAFGLRMKKVNKEEINRRVSEIIELVKLNGYEKRKPADLSGGQQQRVAIARALVNKPKILLLDEPLSALDLKLRKQMQIDLKMLQKKLGITFVYVTHNQEEALTLSNRIVLIHNGKIEQLATPKQMYENPKTKFVADFIGESNIFEGEIVKRDKEKAYVEIENEKILINNKNYKLEEKLYIIIRPEKFRIKKESKKNNKLAVTIIEKIYDGANTKVIVKSKNKEKIQALIANDEQTFNIRDNVFLEWDLEDMIVIRNEENENI